MVLKRLLITALGALSLGALATGPVSAQQIPAPDAYGDPQACAASIKAVTAAADKGKVGDNGLTKTQTAALTNMARSCAGDVGGGIAKARTLYQAAADATVELKAAEKAYEDDDSARNMEKRDEAKTAHDMAVAARNAHSGGGTIYEAVYAEEDRRAAATAASSAWTKAYAAAQAAETLRDTVELENYITDFAGFDSTGQAYEFETYTVKTTADNPETADTDETAYTTYVRVKKQGGATVGLVRRDPKDDTSDLIVPPDLALTKVNPDGMPDGMVAFEVETIDDDLDDTTDMISFLRVTTDVLDDNRDSTTIGMVNDEYKMAKDNLKAAEKALAGNQDGNLTIGLTEDVRRAQAQYDFFAAQKARVEKSLAAGDLVVDRMGDNPATPNEVETGHDLQDTPYTVEDYEGLTDLQDAATDAADALKAAYDDRVAATNDLEANQRDTQQYLDQLVLLRQSQKDAADAARPATATEGEDTAAQKAAKEKLATAEAQLASFNALQALSDDNPVKALVNALVQADDSAEDDDGQALVDAIDATYQTANDAMTAVEGLGGADGEVAMNTAKNAEQDMKLMQKKEYIDNLAAEMGVDPVTGIGTEENGMSRIDNNETRSMTNAGNIMTNTGNIATNTADIATNTGGIMMNSGRIDTNAMGVSTNAGAIDANSMGIAANERNISGNTAMIGELSESLEVVRAGVAASMALAGMPAINGRGISIGVGSFDGESAFAVGFQIQSDTTSFKVGVTSSGGATGASAGVGFQF